VPAKEIETCLTRPLRYDGPRKRLVEQKNGELLGLLQGEFEVFLTADQNLTYQQTLSASSAAIIVLVALSNRIEDLSPLMPKVLQLLEKIKPGEVARVSV
jgi:hypothetical protein